MKSFIQSNSVFIIEFPKSSNYKLNVSDDPIININHFLHTLHQYNVSVSFSYSSSQLYESKCCKTHALFKEFHNKQKNFEFIYSFVKEVNASSLSQSAIIPNVNKVLHIINDNLLFRMIHLLKTL